MCKFCIVDDFCRIYQDWIKHQLLKGNKQRFREGKLSLNEEISVMIFSIKSREKYIFSSPEK